MTERTTSHQGDSHATGVRGRLRLLLLIGACLMAGSCTLTKLPYTITKGAVISSYYVVKGGYELTAGTCKIAYRLGEFTYEVVRAPLNWHFTHDMDAVDGISPRDAIRQGRVRTSPYTVKGRTYYPMSVEQARGYSEEGMASWYGEESCGRTCMTANGEVFKPGGLTAAHKLLPLPIHVRVTNLENDRSVILRVNDRGPFPSIHNPSSGRRIIDVSSGAAKQLGFYKKGLARVKVEVIEVNEG